MKLSKILGLFLVSTSLMTSCINWGDEEYDNYYVNMVTVSHGGVNPVFEMDDSVSLVPDFAFPADTFEVGERYFIYYYIGDTLNHPTNVYPISLTSYNKANIQDFLVLEHDSLDTLYDQPINDIQFIWFSGRYWNFMVSTFFEMTPPNSLELIRNKTNEMNSATDEFPIINFELRHNVRLYSPSLIRNNFISYNLDTLSKEFPQATKFKLNLSYNHYFSGLRTAENVYIPNAPIPFLNAKLHSESKINP